ncbi:glycosyltransferase family 1 protein [Persicobacter psychrovividus]|uniref:Glycosyl transferase family 1 n=1 Tax=Persicobacter psychrovividus TaxID=387638 RepID=A0ABM7VAW8_9BACT|nr:glycosyl transferase family 1 [Persicobacter psychrovividus]
MHKIAIILDRLKNIHSGLGQVSLNFGKAITKQTSAEIAINVLVPKTQKHLFDDYDKVEVINFFRKNKIHLFAKKYDLWHLLHQAGGMEPPQNSKFIFTIHDLNFLHEGHDEAGVSKFKEDLSRKISNASYLTYISNFTKKEVEHFFPIAKNKASKVVYNGVKVQKKEFHRPQRLPEGKFLFTIGQLHAKKNFHTLIPFLQKTDQYHLVIAGEQQGAYAEKIQQMIKSYGLEDRVSLLGAVTEYEKSYLYKYCTAFLFPSLLEGFGLPIIEALHFNKPVFASNKTSLPEVGGDFTYYWDSFDPEEMIKVFENGMADHAQREEHHEQSLQVFLEKYNWQRNAQTYFTIYKELLNEQ